MPIGKIIVGEIDYHVNRVRVILLRPKFSETTSLFLELRYRDSEIVSKNQ
ncbi:44415_t:CDS:1, partial [Gigaspora margarita]